MSKSLANILNDYYVNLELELLELLEFYVHEPKQHLVHQMRVNKKKQLTFIISIKALLPDEALESLESLLRAFQKRLGKVRNYQVQRHQVKQIESELGLDAAFSASMHEQERKFIKRWWKFREKRNLAKAMADFRKTLHTVLLQTPTDIMEEQLLSQMRHVLFEIKCLSNIAGFDTDAFHELRSFFKYFLFNWNLLQFYFSRIPISLEFLNSIKQLEHHLGEWHDNQSLLKKLDEKKQENLVYTVKEKLEQLTLQARALLLELETSLPVVEPYFLSRNEAFS